MTTRDELEAAIAVLEKMAEWFKDMQHGMNGSGFHQGIAAAAAKCRQEAGEWRVKLAALPPEPRDEALERAAQWLESAANRCESILETSPEYHLLGDIADYRREAAAIRAARGTK